MTNNNTNFQKGSAVGIFLIIIALLVAGGIYYFSSRDAGEEAIDTEKQAEEETTEEKENLSDQMTAKGPSQDKKMMSMNDNKVTAMLLESLELEYTHTADLEDVTDGGNSSGTAKAGVFDGTYKMVATFENLPEPKGTDFYEGWVVRKDPLDVISTGKLVKINDQYVNVYASEQDLLDHDFYVLTIEPDDGDPAPADHILEGTFVEAR